MSSVHVRRSRAFVALAAALVALAIGPRARAGDEEPEPGPPAADIEEHLGRAVDRDLAFTDMEGQRVRLGELFGDGKPVLIVLAYYRCPMLCGLVLRGTALALSRSRFRLGEHLHAVTVSIDPRERPAAARDKRASTLAALGLAESSAEWPFLIGDTSSIDALAETLGFRYTYDPRSDQYAHPAAAFVLTPDGRISRYLYGPDPAPRDLEMALLEASRGEIGTLVDRVIMTCYRWDPAARRYGPFITGFFRIGALFVLLAAGGMLAILFWRERGRRGE